LDLSNRCFFLPTLAQVFRVLEKIAHVPLYPPKANNTPTQASEGAFGAGFNMRAVVQVGMNDYPDHVLHQVADHWVDLQNDWLDGVSVHPSRAISRTKELLNHTYVALMADLFSQLLQRIHGLLKVIGQFEYVVATVCQGAASKNKSEY